MIQQTMGQFNCVTRGLLLRVLKEDSRVCFSQNPKKEILLLVLSVIDFQFLILDPEWTCCVHLNYSPALIFKSMSDATAIASAAVSYSISYLTSKFIIKFLESSLEGAKLT